MKYTLKLSKWRYILIAITITIVATIVSYLYLIQTSKPTVPQINLNYEEEYIGDILTVTGTITADCPCALAGTINNEDLQLGENGDFSFDLDVSESDTFLFRIEAIATGTSFNKSTVKSEIEAESKRKQVKVYDSKNPSEWDSGKIELKLKGEPGTQIELKSSLKRSVFGDKSNENETIDTKSFELDEEGFVTVNTAFNTAYNTEYVSYLISAQKEGYLPYEGKIKVENLKYDTEKVNIDKEAYELEKKFNSMEIGTGNLIKIIVNKDIKTSRTISYRYVLDSENYHFISIWVVVSNSSNSSHHANPNNFTIQDSSGKTYNPDQATYSYDTYFDAITLQPYSHASGMLAFIVPKEEKELTLIYDSYDEVVYKTIYIR